MEPEKNLHVVGIGELLWDLLPGGRQLGGAPANFAFHAQNLGAESSMVSSVGSDDLGGEILQALRDLNLNISFIQLNPRHKTGVVKVKLSGGIPEYTIKNNVAWDFIGWAPELKFLAEKADAVCFGSLAQRNTVSRKSILHFLKKTRPGCLRVFDINLRQNYYNREIIGESMELASVLKLNDEELAVVAEIFSFKGPDGIVLEKLMERFKLELVAFTKGSRGSLLKTSGQESFLKVPKVEVSDTVGAGDAFTAAMVMAKLKGKGLTEIHRAANEVAAFVCSNTGATPTLPENLAGRFFL